ncbi:MAG: hypothetical protein WAW17_03355 [Rhodococcus sp. (in: high G+C Gram-positive bacteria)]
MNNRYIVGVVWRSAGPEVSLQPHRIGPSVAAAGGRARERDTHAGSP